MDTRARAVQAQPTPPKAGTKHLAKIIEAVQKRSRTLGAPRQRSSSADCWEQRKTHLQLTLDVRCGPKRLLEAGRCGACKWRNIIAWQPFHRGWAKGLAGLQDRSASSGGAHHGSCDA